MVSKKNPKVYEILEKVSKCRKDETKIGTLQKYDCSALRTVLLLNFHDQMKFVKFDDAEYLPCVNPTKNLIDDYATLGHMTEGGGKMKGTDEEIRQVYVKFLSSIDPEDAEVVSLCRKKVLDLKYNITKENVEEAFPELNWS